jgi:nifR3 family TIM-barrel protein
MYQFGKLIFPHPPVLLAPMEDVTDSSYRRICRSMGADWLVSEFISVEGILNKEDHFGHKLNFLPQERPFSIQIFGNKPENIQRAIHLIEPLQPDFIDLNMGCPVKKIVSKGAGAALIQYPELMAQLAKAAVGSSSIPVTVKTRIGWDLSNISIHDTALRLQDTGISALIIHGRTKSQMYSGEANWNVIAEVKNNSKLHIPVIGNGDITTAEQAIEYPGKYGVDGVMIGRATFGNPFIFRQIRELRAGKQPELITIDERIATVKQHFMLSAQWKGLQKTIFEIRKHYAGYFKHFPDFKPFRMKLMLALSQTEVFEVLDEIAEKYAEPTNNYEP